MVTARHDNVFIERRLYRRKVKWNIRDGFEPSRATKLERERRYLQESAKIEPRYPETVRKH